MSAPPTAPGANAEDLIAVLDDGPSVAVRVFRPEGSGTDRAGLVWIHGGGYILGSARAADSRVTDWVERLGCVVVSVDYRLAPENPYPAALDDCSLALRWTFARAEPRMYPPP
jgi:acetyl esterase